MRVKTFHDKDEKRKIYSSKKSFLRLHLVRPSLEDKGWGEYKVSIRFCPKIHMEEGNYLEGNFTLEGAIA